MSVVGPLAPTPAGLRLATTTLLSTKPWLHDPMVNPMPWQAEIEEKTLELARGKKLAFAVLKSDGACSVHPPIARALEELSQKLQKAGHKVIEWAPPNHKKLADICVKAWSYDGGADARKAFGLSGEPPKASIMSVEETKMFNATEIMENQVDKREAQKEYLEYWNSTEELTGTGRPVDAFITPLAPFASARPEKYTYYAYSAIVNVLDYTSVAVPVTRVDKTIDQPYSDFTPINETDRITQELCKSREIRVLCRTTADSDD